MRIAQIAPLVESVPPQGYGGTELVVHLLTEELVERGHDVTLFASGDSKTSAKLIACCPEYLRRHENANRHRWAAYDINMLLRLGQMQSEFDVIHNHLGWQALPLLSGFTTPVVTTIHNPIVNYCKDIYLAYAQVPFVSISDAFRKFNYGDRLNYVATVYNGIDTSLYRQAKQSKLNYLLFIGRISPLKGTAEAIQIAKAAGMPLKIAGKVDVCDHEYFKTEIEPKLEPGNIEYIGEVGPERKAELYSGAYAVVYPIAFEEPFGLVMAESLASGTPVIALDRGSVREVLSDGETAVIGSSVDELISRFGELSGITAEQCRQRAVSLFSKRQMACGYEEAYAKLIKSSPAKNMVVSSTFRK